MTQEFYGPIPRMVRSYGTDIQPCEAMMLIQRAILESSFVDEGVELNSLTRITRKQVPG